MSYRLLLQLPDNHPSDLIDKGVIDLFQAIEAFENFEWQTKYNLVKSRKRSHLTSPLPEMIIENNERNVSLHIVYYGEDKFCVTYKSDNLVGYNIINDNNEENEDETVKEYIVAFFENNIAEKIDLAENEIEEETENYYMDFGKYNPLKQIRYPGFTILLTILIIILPVIYNSTDSALIMFVLTLGIGFPFVIFLPFFVIFLHYIYKPIIISARIDQNKKGLTITYQNEKVHIEKNNILLCEYVHTKNQKYMWSNFENLVFIMKDKTRHVFTTLTFSTDELNRIIDLLDINYYDRAVMLPFISKRIEDESSLRKVKYKPEMAELIELYANYKDEELIKIVQNEAEYQEEAVEIAKNELKKREQPIKH
jgi:hypothetical protein